jgi:riboflavin synthase
VQGHVDGVGLVESLAPEGDQVVVRIAAPPAVAPYLVPKGFIAVDGASLTIVDVDGASFTIALIPHTRAETTLGLLAPGSRVNLEADILGKYVERMLAARLG